MSRLWKSRIALVCTSIASLFPAALAAPLLPRQAQLQALSQGDISAFKPFTFYASASYCEPDKLLTWTCGGKDLVVFRSSTVTNYNDMAENCLQNPNFQPVAAGGDGGDVQFWYVGIDPTLEVGASGLANGLR
jgi:hypothetical protein